MRPWAFRHRLSKVGMQKDVWWKYFGALEQDDGILTFDWQNLLSPILNSDFLRDQDTIPLSQPLSVSFPALYHETVATFYKLWPTRPSECNDTLLLRAWKKRCETNKIAERKAHKDFVFEMSSIQCDEHNYNHLISSYMHKQTITLQREKYKFYNVRILTRIIWKPRSYKNFYSADR